jgi:radical SAM protein with 4Fe4S-binding SPASM domain
MPTASSRGQAEYTPTVVTIDNHRACNAKCRMCPTQNVDFAAGRMSDAIFDELLTQIADVREGLHFVQFGVHGEPLLDRDLETRIARIRQLGVPVWVATNGAAMTPARARRFLDADVSVMIFSIDGATKETYERIRIGLDFERTVRHVDEFFALRDAMEVPTKIVMRFIEQPLNAAERAAWEAYWSVRFNPRFADSFHALPMHNWAAPLAGVGGYGDRPCPDLMGSILISSDGSVPLCCLDYDGRYSFGNIMKAHLRDILNGRARSEARRLHDAGRRREMEKCRTCYLPEIAPRAPDAVDYDRAVIENDLHWNED